MQYNEQIFTVKRIAFTEIRTLVEKEIKGHRQDVKPESDGCDIDTDANELSVI